MANRTDPSAQTVHNTNPQFLIEKIIRMKIYANSYWKEHCFGLNSETLVDKAIELRYIGGTYGGTRKPTKFLCLILKMLQIQPEKEIIFEFLKAKEYKYVTALAMFYLRLIGRSEEIYQFLEPFYNDNRKLIKRKGDGRFEIIHMDEFVEELLNSEHYLDVVLTRIPKRMILEDNGVLEPRISALEEDLEEENKKIEDNNAIINSNIEKKENDILENKEDNNSEKIKEKKKKKKRSRSRSRSKKHKKDKNNSNWEKIKKHTKTEKNDSSNTKNTHEDNLKSNNNKEVEFSIEYWNRIRSELGMKLLPENKN